MGKYEEFILTKELCSNLRCVIVGSLAYASAVPIVQIYYQITFFKRHAL